MDGGGGETTTTTTTEVRGLKKGPWTATEDGILTEYVRSHGEGNWNAVQKHSGLLRCGKSCRLRWANHLRPNLKKGAFTPDEERMIIELHARLGNKWARMASQLPGRTDNEIKNYWNTRMKRRQRANLPLYPLEIHPYQGNDQDRDDEEFEFDDSFQFPNQDHHQNHNQNMIHHQYTNSSNNTPSSSSSFSSSSSQPPKRLCFNPLVPTNSQMFTPYNYSLHENDHNNRFGFSYPLSSSSSSNELCNPNHILEYITENSDTNNYNRRDIDAMSFSSLLMCGDLHDIRQTSFPPLGVDLPSIHQPTHSFSSNASLTNCLPVEPAVGNSGLLDALLQESQALSRGGTNLCADQDQRVKMDFQNRLIAQHLNSSHQSSFGTNPNIPNNYNEPTTVKATSDDEDELLMSLLNNFPSTTPLPDWYQTTTPVQPEAPYLASPRGMLAGNHQANGLVEPSKAPPSSTVQSLGQRYWTSLPRIC